VQARKELKAAMLQAETANQAKSEFIANMSHEVRTPLNAILGMTGLIMESGVTARQRDMLQLVLDSGYALFNMLSSILEFSRIDMNKAEVCPVDFNLKEEFASIVNSFMGMTEKKKLLLTSRLAPEIPELVNGDPGKLRQILGNLLNNAVKFTVQGEISVQVEPFTVTDQKIILRFTVTDTGIGIPKDKQKFIFDAFSQVESAATRKYEGTGLGLAIASKLLKMLGGEIDLESEVGKGSSFHFVIPFSPPRKQPVPLGTDTVTIPVFRSNPKTVLVVESDPHNRAYLQAILDSLKYKTFLAGTGAQALEILQQEAVDLILIDMQLPGGTDGDETVRQIRQQEKEDEHLPIIAMSASAGEEERERCFKVGVNDFLPMPFTKPDLLKKITSLC
jgi:CheY-like chemotaxis protein